jgi:hypothetical protein
MTLPTRSAFARRTAFGLAMLPLLAAGARARPGSVAFRVVREGREVGTHAVRIAEQDRLLVARSELRVAVRLAGFTVFRWTQDAEEAWRDDRLVAFEGASDRNGQASTCRGRAEANGLRLRGPAGEALLPAAAAPLTWWRAANLAGGVPLFDPREGRPITPALERRAERGGQRVKVVAESTSEAVYDAAGTWIGFATIAEDGSSVLYQRA